MEWAEETELGTCQVFVWQMNLSWGRNGGWVMGRKNWMSFRVSFSLTQTGWSSRQMWRQEVPWQEKGISRLERSFGQRGREIVPALSGHCKGHCKGLGEEGTAYLEIWLLWRLEGKGAWCGCHWTGYIGLGGISWQRTLGREWTWMLTCRRLLATLQYTEWACTGKTRIFLPTIWIVC